MTTYNTINITKIFIQFLIQNHVYESFILNFYEYHKRVHNEIKLTDFLHYFDTSKAINILSAAFDWDSTPQGYDFWYDIYQKWHSTLFNHTFKIFILLLKKNNIYGNIIHQQKNNNKTISKLKTSYLNDYPKNMFENMNNNIQYENVISQWKQYLTIH